MSEHEHGEQPNKNDSPSSWSLKAAWHSFYEFIHPIYVSIQIYELAAFASSLTGIVIVIKYLEDPIVLAVLVIFIVNIIVLVLYGRKYRREHALLEEEVRRNSKLVESSHIAEQKIEAEHDVNREIVSRFSSAYTIAASLADRHSDCDRALFDEFSAVLVRPITARTLLQKFNIGIPSQAMMAQHQHVREAGLYLARDNVKDTLEKVCAFLREFTGDVSCACIKTYDPQVSDDLRDAAVLTIYRDYTSKADREADQTKYKIYQNTITATIFIKKTRIWACDDLKAEADKRTEDGNPAYINMRPNWQSYYNATVGVGIRDLTPNAKRPFAAVLCVDNSKGRLNNAVCKSFLLQVSARLAVMLYRIEHLQNGSR